MGDYGSVGKAVGELLAVIFWASLVVIPLALWKLVEIAIWLWRHVSISIN